MTRVVVATTTRTLCTDTRVKGVRAAKLVSCLLIIIGVTAGGPTLHASGSASVEDGRACGVVAIDGYRYRLTTRGLTCAGARAKLRVLLRSDRRPKGYRCALNAFVCWQGRSYEKARRRFAAYAVGTAAYTGKSTRWLDPRRCGVLVFTPRSDDRFSDIRVRGYRLRARSAGSATLPVQGRRPLRTRVALHLQRRRAVEQRPPCSPAPWRCTHLGKCGDV